MDLALDAITVILLSGFVGGIGLIGMRYYGFIDRERRNDDR